MWAIYGLQMSSYGYYSLRITAISRLFDILFDKFMHCAEQFKFITRAAFSRIS